MSESFEFREVTHFTAGAIGEPGARVFYLQAGDSERYVSIKLEKQQVIALATYLQTVLEDLPAPTVTDAEPVPLLEPALPEWIVGQIAVGVDEDESAIVLVIEELVELEQEDDIADLLGDVSTGASLRVHVSVDQATQFIATSDELMTKGRPPCRLCGQPDTPGGHACPRLN